MRILTRFGITALCLLAAIACYSFGVPTGGLLFFILGLGFEAVFWRRIFQTKT